MRWRLVVSVSVLALGAGLCLPPGALGAEPTTTRVSVAGDGTQANDWSSTSVISGNGRYVAFASWASNLVPGDTNGAPDIFVRDRQTGATTRESVSTAGAQANAGSSEVDISSDGRYVAFRSHASNLVTGDTNHADDIFVRDRQNATTTRASVATDGTQADDDCVQPQISANGRYVAFASWRSNLVLPDSGFGHVFLRDTVAATTTRVSETPSGGEADGYSQGPSMSPNGRYVAFESAASNLVTRDTNARTDVFVWDRLAGAAVRVSVAASGAQGNGGSGSPSVSGDGMHVAFTSSASNLVAGDTNGRSDAFVHDRASGDGPARTTRVTVATDGTQGDAHVGWMLAMTPDARFVTYYSEATNLVAGDTNGQADVFVHDRNTASTTRVSVATDGTPGNAWSAFPSISNTGRFVAFTSSATNLVPEDTNFLEDAFVRDRG